MTKLKTLPLLAAILAAAGIAHAAGVEHSSSTSREASRTQSTDKSAKSGADSDIGLLLSSGLTAVRPLDDEYRQRIFQHGWALDMLTADRLGADAAVYATQRIAALRASRQPEAQWAAAHLAQCGSKPECITDFASHETLGQAIQATHAGWGAPFAEAVVSGRRQVMDTAFYSKFQPALFWHSTTANSIESTLGSESAQAGPMPLAARRLRLVEQFFALPLPPFEIPQVQGKLLMSGPASPYQLQLGESTFTANDRGIFRYSGGGTVFGGGFAGGVKYTFTDSASGSQQTSKSTKSSTSSAKRSATNE